MGKEEHQKLVFMLNEQVQQPINSQVLILDLLMTCYTALNHWIWDYFFFMGKVEKHIPCRGAESQDKRIRWY